MHGKEDIWSEEEGHRGSLCVLKNGGRSLRTHDLFLHRRMKGRDFPVRAAGDYRRIFPKEYSNLVTGDGNEEIKAQIRRFAGEVYSG